MTKLELKHKYENRINNLISMLREADQPFDTAFIVNKVNQYYYTGTMQDGVLVVRQDGLVLFYVRKSFYRAREECPLDCVKQMRSYRDMLADLPKELGHVWLEQDIMPLVMLQRLQKVFEMAATYPLESAILTQRAVKDEEEIALITESGRQHEIVMTSIIPSLLQAGMSETDFMADLYQAMLKLGYQGVSRFGMFQMEMVIGQMGFGDHSLEPTNFDGPGGMRGMSPAVPIIGSRTRKLKTGDLVFVDVGYGVEGYHSDKTQVYSFGCEPDEEVKAVHQTCRQLLHGLSAQLIAGAIPEDIYHKATQDKPQIQSDHFMGYKDEQVRFFGHGVGLQIDEMPVIAMKQKQPLQENMVVALEPKCGVPGKGMVGVEETYLVRKGSPLCLTGGDRDIIVVKK